MTVFGKKNPPPFGEGFPLFLTLVKIFVILYKDIVFKVFGVFGGFGMFIDSIT